MTYLPTESERKRVKTFVDRLTDEVLASFTEEGFGTLTVIPVGSTVKGTFVSGEHDVDIYVITDDPQRAEIHGSLQFEPDTGYHKHAGPLRIWHFRRGDFEVDLVFTDPNSPKVDTFKHVEYFNKHLTDKQRDEVVKLKAVFKTSGVYGAEQGGITGVALEELVNKRGTASEVCASLTTHTNDLWLQDPVLKTKRNLLASITPLRWRQLENACWSFLKDPQAFRPKSFGVEDFKARFLKEHPEDSEFREFPRMSEDSLDFNSAVGITLSAMRKLGGMEPDLKGRPLVFLTDTFVGKEDITVAVSLPESLPQTRIQHVSKEFKEGVEGFKKRHSNWFDDENWVMAEVPRRVTSPREFFWKEVSEGLEAKLASQQGLRGDFP